MHANNINVQFFRPPKIPASGTYPIFMYEVVQVDQELDHQFKTSIRFMSTTNSTVVDFKLYCYMRIHSYSNSIEFQARQLSTITTTTRTLPQP